MFNSENLSSFEEKKSSSNTDLNSFYSQSVEKEQAFRKIMFSVSDTFDIKKIVNSIVKEIGYLFGADRCFIVEYSPETDNILPVEDYAQYLSSEEIRSHLEVVPTKEELEKFAELSRERKDVFVKNIEEIDLPEISKKMLRDELSVKSYLVIQIYDKDDFYGGLVLHYVKDYKELSVDDMAFVRAIATQVAIILKQARLYKIMQKQNEREKLLREITSVISSTYDFDKIRKIFVTRLGEALDADISALYLVDSYTNDFVAPDEHSLYFKSGDNSSILGKNVIKEFEWDSYIKENKRMTIAYSDIEDMKVEYNLFGTKAEQCMEYFQMKSVIATPILYADVFLGFLVISFLNKPRLIQDEDAHLARVVADQAAISLYQSRLYAQAQESSRAKSEFIANMSHEFKTPLNIIIGFSELLSKNKVDDEKLVTYLHNIYNSGKHLLKLTEDIINISKIESGNFKLFFEEVDIQEIILNVVNSIKVVSKEKNIEISVDLISGTFSLDKKILTQVLYNLIDNAIKFTPQDGKIIIKSWMQEDNLAISVKDSGLGIVEQDQQMIFEKFKQVDSSVAKSQQGAGLGLAISKKLIELQGGNIYLESAKGEGSCFWFTIPNNKVCSNL